MTSRGRVCRRCGCYNGPSEQRCYRCGSAFPGPIGIAIQDALTTLLGEHAHATKVLVGACIVAFLFTTLQEGRLELLSLSRAVAIRWGALEPRPHSFEPLRYLSANFVHFGLIHLVLNMMMLWSFGSALEERAGGARMAVVFFVTGFMGFLASDLVYTFGGQPIVTGGASAGIAGLIGGFIGFAFAQGNPVWKRALISIVLYSVVFAVAVPVRINHAAHIAGLGVGGLFGIALFKQRGRYGPIYDVFAWICAALTLVAVVLARAGF